MDLSLIGDRDRGVGFFDPLVVFMCGYSCTINTIKVSYLFGS